jgi:hypothetical protein
MEWQWPSNPPVRSSGFASWDCGIRHLGEEAQAASNTEHGDDASALAEFENSGVIHKVRPEVRR